MTFLRWASIALDVLLAIILGNVLGRLVAFGFFGAKSIWHAP